MSKSYVRFESEGKDQWEVRSTRGAGLGTVYRAQGWRQYVFAPLPDTEYSADCLWDIANFLDKAKEGGG